jgi:hypothetical protein
VAESGKMSTIPQQMNVSDLKIVISQRLAYPFAVFDAMGVIDSVGRRIQKLPYSSRIS